MLKTCVTVFAVLVICSVALFTQSSLRPVAWQPDGNPELSGPFIANSLLESAYIIGENQLNAPEDIFVSDNGRVYSGLANGDIISFHIETPHNITTIANTGGRPLGIRLDANNDLIVSDAAKGLLRVSHDGEIHVLVDSFNGRKLQFVDHHDIASNGDIYFSDASERYGFKRYIHDFIEASATGSIYKYSPLSGETSRIMSNLFFANGVALGPNDDYLLVAETGRARILKHQLNGPSTGTTSVFADELPAMPDNLSYNGKDTLWAGMVSLRDWRVEKLAHYPLPRRIIGALPLSWFEPTSHYGFVLGFNLKGDVTANYQTSTGYTGITGVYQYKNTLVLGSLYSQGMGVFDMPK